MRLVLEVIGNDGVIVLISGSEPSEGLDIVCFRDVVPVPDRMVMSGRISLYRVDVDHDLHSVLLAKGQKASWNTCIRTDQIP